MAKILTFTFSFFIVTSLLSDSISKKELSALRQKVISLYNEKKYKESIPELEKYLSFRDEVRFKIYLAKSLLFRNDLEEPKEEDEIFLRQEKISKIIKNYQRSARIFSDAIPFLEAVTPNDSSLSNLYFLWAYSEWFGDNREKAIQLFKKSVQLKLDKEEMTNFNIAALYDELGQQKDSQIYFDKKLTPPKKENEKN